MSLNEKITPGPTLQKEKFNLDPTINPTSIGRFDRGSNYNRDDEINTRLELEGPFNHYFQKYLLRIPVIWDDSLEFTNFCKTDFWRYRKNHFKVYNKQKKKFFYHNIIKKAQLYGYSGRDIWQNPTWINLETKQIAANQNYRIIRLL